MERIQEAIEKARRERTFNRAEPTIGRNLGMSEASILTEPSTHGPARAAVNPEQIHYSNTRHVPLDEAHLKSRKLVGGMAHDPRSDAYRQLRGILLKKMRTNNWKTIAITSPSSGNGKTLTAINLAISLSQEVNQTVLLADFNLRNPTLAQTLGIDDIAFGITSYLNDGVPLDKILINPQYSRFVLLPGCEKMSHSSEMLTSPKMRGLIEELCARYTDRIILFVLPPLLLHDDALTFIPHVDATLLVLEDGGCSKSELERAVKLLDNHPLAGTVLNKVR